MHFRKELMAIWIVWRPLGRGPIANKVTGHVGKDATALPLRLPEPRHVRPAMLLGGARQIGTATDRTGTERRHTMSLPRWTALENTWFSR